MKNLVKSALVAAVVSASAIPSFAETAVISPLTVQDTIVKDTLKKDVPETILLAQAEVTYTKVEVSELPATVTAGVAAKYEGYTVDEAWKGSDNTYKLNIKKEDATLTVYFNEAGEFVKEEASPATQIILG